MLQQTQARRVAAVFSEFVRRFPTIHALARASDDSILAAWSGLGYYRRALQLRDSAIQIQGQFRGRIPERVEELRALPGVGPYTAGAIASVAFGVRAPIVDGNVARVALRVLGNPAEPNAPQTRALLWHIARILVENARDPAILNEGLMELGAVVCTPSAPGCDECPISHLCNAFRTGRQSVIPAPRQRAGTREVHHHAVIVRRGERILLERRGHCGLWAGMWQTPTIESDRPLKPTEITAGLPFRVVALARVGAFRHQTTHRKITFHVFTAKSRAKMGNWIPVRSICHFPFSSPQRRLLTVFAGLRRLKLETGLAGRGRHDTLEADSDRNRSRIRPI